MPSVTNTSNAGRSVTIALAPNACRFASYARARLSTSTRPLGCGIASTLTGDCDAAAPLSSTAEGVRYFFLATSTSTSVGCRYCCFARSISCSVGSRTCADAPMARRNEPTARITLERTAVPLPEQEIREVLALNRVLLPGAPENRATAKRLTAPAVDLGGVGNRIGHLRLVGTLVHDRVGHRTAKRLRAVIAPGHELPMHLARQALRDQHRGLHPPDVGRDVAIERIDAALAAGAPEELWNSEPDTSRHAVDRAGGERDRVGKQDRVGVEDGGELVVLPQRVDLGEIGQIEPACLKAVKVEQHLEPVQHWIGVPMRLVEGAGGGPGSARPLRRLGRGEPRIQADPAQAYEAKGFPGHIDLPGGLPEADR